MLLIGITIVIIGIVAAFAGRLKIPATPIRPVLRFDRGESDTLIILHYGGDSIPDAFESVDYVDEQTTQATDQALYSGAIVRAVQRKLIENLEVLRMEAYLKRTTETVGLVDVWFRIRLVSDDPVLREEHWGASTNLDTAYAWQGVDFTPIYLDEEVRFAIEHVDGNSENYVIAGFNNADVVPGYFSVYDTAWTDQTDNDLTYKLTFRRLGWYSMEVRLNGGLVGDETKAILNGENDWTGEMLFLPEISSIHLCRSLLPDDVITVIFKPTKQTLAEIKGREIR